MTRAPVLPLAILLTCVGMLGAVYMRTRPAPEAEAVPLDRVAQAVATTSAVKSFRFAVAATQSGSGSSFTFSGSGTYDLEHKLVGMTMRLEHPPAGTPASATQPMDLVLDYSGGFVEYMRWQVLNGHLPAGKTWLKIDVGKLAKKEGVDLERLMQAESGDPTKMFDVLRRAAAPTRVGEEAVGGVSTTHYSATVDLRRFAALEPDEKTRESLQRAIGMSGVSSYPVDVWIDGKGYLRRMRATIVEAPPDAPGTISTMSVTEELSDFDAPAQVSLPPAADVADIDEASG